MKRNETVLVYAVTGLLVVILGIAVIFGEDANAARDPKTDKVAKGEGDLGIMDQGVPGVGKVTPHKQPAELPPQPKEDPDKKDPGGLPVPKTDPKDTVKPVSLVAKKSAAELVLQRFGASSREGVYREVLSRPGDRLASMARRWCGKDGKDWIEQVEGLNEDYADGRPIPSGSKVIVPWVDDADLLESHRDYKPAPAPKVATTKTYYTVQPGDNLWKIAVKRVGARKAPAYIKQIAEANPDIENLDFLREKQKLILP